MKQVYKYMMLAAVALTVAGEVWGSVTTEGTAPGTVTINGTTYYYVMAATAEKECTATVNRDENVLPADKLFLQMKYQDSWPAVLDQKVKIESSLTGTWNSYNTVASTKVTSSYVQYGAYTTNINRKTKYIKASSDGGTKTKKVKNIYLTMATYCEAPTSTYDFGSNIYKVTTDRSDIRINWSNLASANIEIGGTNADQFEIVEQTTLGSAVGKCGYTLVTVRYKRTAIGSHTATLKVNGQSMSITLEGKTEKADLSYECPVAGNVVSQAAVSNSALSGGWAKHPTLGTAVGGTWSWQDGTLAADCHNKYTAVFTPSDQSDQNGYNSAACELSLTDITKIGQTIIWNDPAGEIGGDMAFTATAGAGVEVYFTSSNTAVATIVGNTIHWLRSGEVTITAHADADCNYNAAADVSKTFTMSQNLPTVVSATATGITYGQTLSASVITGVVQYGGTTLSGTWSWVNPDLLPEVGTAQQEAMFTPQEGGYAAVTTMVDVTVGKLTPTITYISCPILREGNTYNNPFRSDNQETGFSVTITPTDGVVSWNAEAGSLVVGTVTTERSYTLEVCQAETEHFVARCATFTLPVRKKSEVCVPVTTFYDEQNQPLIFNKMRLSGDGTWCFTTGWGSGTYLGINVDYYQHAGIQIGTWRDGWNVISNEGRSVVLYFNGVPDKLSFDTKAESAYTAKGTIFETHYSISNNQWSIHESADGSNWTTLQAKTANGTQIQSSTKYSLDPDTRYIKIVYYGNFAGYIPAETFTLTRRHGFEVGADRNHVTQTTMPKFGTEANPLQIPQQITFRYYSLGECGSENDTIAVSSTNPAFYADVEKISRNVDFDQWGEYVLTVRSTDVGQTGQIKLTATNGDQLLVNVSSATPDIAANTGIFHTGTEQYHKTDTDPYRGMTQVDFSPCFSGGVALFDSLYIFGVTGNTEAVRNKFDYYDVSKEYWLPKVNTPTEAIRCNSHTPLFVYYKTGDHYSYRRTIQNASESGLDIQASDRSLAFVGYCPFAFNGTNNARSGFAVFTSDGTAQTDITLLNTEIGSRPHTPDGTLAEAGYANSNVQHLVQGDNGIGGSGSVFSFQNTSSANAYNAGIHAYGHNQLTATRGADVNVAFGAETFAAVQPSAAIAVNTQSTDTKVNIIIDDLYCDSHTVESSLYLTATSGVGSIDLGNESSTLTVNGGVVSLSNGTTESNPLAVAYRRTLLEDNGEVAILYGLGADQTDAKVFFKDGTIIGEDILKMPYHTTVTGGTYPQGDLLCYETLASAAARPADADGREVLRDDSGRMLSALTSEYPTYGAASLLPDASGKVHPMLAGEKREDKLKPWVAATPDNEDEAFSGNTKTNSHLLYMEITEGQKAHQGSSSQWNKVVNTTDYSVSTTLSMLLQVDTADYWRTVVAPFDVKNVYVLELADENTMNYGSTAASRNEDMSRQYAAAKSFYEYLEGYIVPKGEGMYATTLPLRALISKYAQTYRGGEQILFPISHATSGSDFDANYYLFRSPAVWEYNGAEISAAWNYAGSGSEVIMRKGETYAVSFPYCPACRGDYHKQNYDYWSGKFILFEGVGQQTISGTAAAVAKIEAAKEIADASCVALTGNGSLGSVPTSDIYRYNPTTDMYEKVQGDVVLSPTESVLYSKQLRAAGIRRNGEIVAGTDNGNQHNGTATGTDSLNFDLNNANTPNVRKVLGNGNIYIIRDGKRYTLLGEAL